VCSSDLYRPNFHCVGKSQKHMFSLWKGAIISSKASVNTTSGFRAAILKSRIYRHGTLSAEVKLCRPTSKKINFAFETAARRWHLNGGLSLNYFWFESHHFWNFRYKNGGLTYGLHYSDGLRARSQNIRWNYTDNSCKMFWGQLPLIRLRPPSWPPIWKSDAILWHTVKTSEVGLRRAFQRYITRLDSATRSKVRRGVPPPPTPDSNVTIFGQTAVC
jgi:hypothetical protein